MSFLLYNLHTINHFSISVAFIKNKTYEGKMQLKASLTPIICSILHEENWRNLVVWRYRVAVPYQCTIYVNLLTERQESVF